MTGVCRETGTYGRQLDTPPVDAAIARLAGPQHGVLTLAQLRASGLGESAIHKRVSTGRLHRLHRGVYAVGHRPPSPRTRDMAAVLACGDGARLSYRSAAALWDFQPAYRGPVHVTAPTYRSHDGVRVHRSRDDARDVTVHWGIPITSPAQTILDLADVLDDATLARAVNEARVQHRLDLGELAALLLRSPGRATSRLLRFVEDLDGPTRSDFEDAFLAFVERYGLPRPKVNQQVAGYTVDVLWRDQRLIVELDSRGYHDHDLPFERDRDRDADLLAAGHPVVRVTWRRLVHQPQREATRLEALLAHRSAALRA